MNDTQKAFKLSQLPALSVSELDGNDLFLVSDSTTTNNEKFVSKKLSYKDLKSEVTKDANKNIKMVSDKANRLAASFEDAVDQFTEQFEKMYVDVSSKRSVLDESKYVMQPAKWEHDVIIDIDTKEVEPNIQLTSEQPYASTDKKLVWTASYVNKEKEIKCDLKFVSTTDISKDDVTFQSNCIIEETKRNFQFTGYYKAHKQPIQTTETYITDKAEKIIQYKEQDIHLQNNKMFCLDISNKDISIIVDDYVLDDVRSNMYAFKTTIRVLNVSKDDITLNFVNNGVACEFESFVENPLQIIPNVPTYLTFTWIGSKWLIEHREVK